MSKVESPALAAGEFGIDTDHADVPGFLGQDQADVGALQVLVLQVLAILIGVQVAGEGIDRLEQAVQRAERDALHVRLFDVLALDMADDVAEDADVFEGVVLGGALAQAPSDQEHKREKRGRTHDQIFQTATHSDLKTPKALRVIIQAWQVDGP